MSILKNENIVAKGISANIVANENTEECKINVGFALEKDKAKIILHVISENGQERMIFVNMNDAAQLENALFHARRMAQGTVGERPLNY